MPSTTTRRQFALVAASGYFATLSGCVDGLFTSEKLAHFVEVSNSSEKTHNIHVLVTDASGETLFSSLFRLESDKWEEDTEPFLGTPTTVQVTVDGNPPKTYDWPGVNCKRERGTRSAGGLQIAIGENGELSRHVLCETITVQ